MEQLRLQSGSLEPAGGTAEDGALEGLRPPLDGGGDSGRSSGHPAASADQVSVTSQEDHSLCEDNT